MMRAVQLMYEGWIDVWYVWMSWCLIVVIWLAIIDSVAIGMAVGQAL